MGWSTIQYKPDRKEPRHARVRLDVVHCVDCERQLHQTHLVALYGERCRPCWQALVVHVPGGVSIPLGYYCEG